MLKIPSEFEAKLKDKGAYELFIRNVENYDKIHSKYSPLNLQLYEHSFLRYIAHAFVWEATPEGYDYWVKIATMEGN